MAIAVPIIMSATGASAAIGAAVGISAGLVTAATGVLVGATGIGRSINKAAAKVFGEDLVSFANIAGGIAMASGWNPGQTWSALTGGAAAGQGALSAPDLMTSDIGVGAASAGGAETATAMQAQASSGALSGGTSGQPVQAGGVDGLRELERAGVDAVLPGDKPVPMVPGESRGALSSITEAWGKAGDRTKAALITAGGQALAGAADGYSRAKDAAEERKERRRREGIFQSGSGLNNTYAPRTPVRSGG